MNLWLAAAPQSQVAFGALGCDVSLNDLCDRPPRPLADGEVIDLGGKRVRQISTPHVPHGWEAQVLFEETTGTLLCGDLFSQLGGETALTTDDIVEPAMAAEAMFHQSSLAPSTGADPPPPRRPGPDDAGHHARHQLPGRRRQGPLRPGRRLRAPVPGGRSAPPDPLGGPPVVEHVSAASTPTSSPRFHNAGRARRRCRGSCTRPSDRRPDRRRPRRSAARRRAGSETIQVARNDGHRVLGAVEQLERPRVKKPAAARRCHRWRASDDVDLGAGRQPARLAARASTMWIVVS